MAEDRLREDERISAERQERFFTKSMAVSGLVGRFRDTTFANFIASTNIQRHALATCQEFSVAAQRGTWTTLVLIGPPGTGKTHLVAAMVHNAIRRGKLARYITFRDLIRLLRATWNRDANHTEQEVIDDLASVPLLVVDEIGLSMSSEAELQQFFDVIDRRYQLANPLVLVSNLPVPDLRAALGDRLYDRIRERLTVVPCDWQSIRGGGRS